MGMETYVLIIMALLASLILVLVDAIFTIRRDYKEYMKSSFRIITNYSFLRVSFDKKLSRQCEMFKILEKNCLTGHLLANVRIKDDKDEYVTLDLVMIDKYGISVFDLEEDNGTISGNLNAPFWRLKRFLFNYKIPNYSLVMGRKLDILKDTLKITDSNIINGYIVFDKHTKFKKIRLENRNIRLLKRPYVNGALAYETANSNRVLNDNEIVSYTILLERFTNLPLYMRDDKLFNEDVNSDSRDLKPSDVYTFEFYRQLSNYSDLKKVWEIICKCDKDVYPPLSLRRNDLDNIPEFAREMLLPNIYFKEIVHHPMVIVRRNNEIIGFLSVEPNKILKLSEELGRINLVDTAIVLKEFRKDGIVSDLYKYIEERLPIEYELPYILVKSSQKNDQINRILIENGYKEKIVVDTRKAYGAATIYYFKKARVL